MSELKSELIVDKVSPQGGKLEIKGKLKLLKTTDDKVVFEIDPDTGTIPNNDFTLGHNELEIPVLVLNDPSSLGFGYITDETTYNNNKINPNKGIKFHTHRGNKHNTFTIGNIQGGLGSITITPKDTQVSAGFTDIQDKIEIHTSEFKTTDSTDNEYIKVKDSNVYFGKASINDTKAKYSGSLSTISTLGTGSTNIIRNQTEVLGDTFIRGNVKFGLGSIRSLSNEGSLLMSHFTHHASGAVADVSLGEAWAFQTYNPNSRGQLAFHTGKESLPSDGLDGWITSASAGHFGAEVQAETSNPWVGTFQTTNPGATTTFISNNNIGRDNQPSIMSRGSLTIGIDGIASDAQTSFFEVISGINDVTNFTNATTLLLIDKNTQTTFVQNLSSSGDLFASASFSNNATYKTIVIDTASGKFYYTGSYGGAGSATFQSLTDGPGDFIVTDTETDLETSYANYAIQVNSNGTELEYVQTVNSASFASSSVTASYALTASFVPSDITVDDATSSSYALSSSYAVSSSLAEDATSASYAVSASNVVSASYALSASHAGDADDAISSSYALTASFVPSDITVDDATSASYALSSSYAVSSSHALNANDATSASYADDSISSSYALTASYALNSDGATTYVDLTDTSDTSLSGKDGHVPIVKTVYDSGVGGFVQKLKLEATVSNAQSSFIAQRAISGGLGLNPMIQGVTPFHIDHNGFKTVGDGLIIGDLGISGSIAVGAGLTISDIQISSSTNAFIFGSGSANSVNHEMTGNLLMDSSQGITANMPADTVGFIGTSSFAETATSASYALTASFISNEIVFDSASFASSSNSASYALSSSHTLSSSYATSASYAVDATSASYALSSSNALTASFALNAEGSGFPFSGNAVITGSLTLSGSGNISTLGIISSSNSITASGFLGDLTGTSSNAEDAVSASYTLSASHAGDADDAISSSYSLSSSYAVSASYALNSDGATKFLE